MFLRLLATPRGSSTLDGSQDNCCTGIVARTSPSGGWPATALHMTDDELVEDGEAIGNLSDLGIVDEVGRSHAHRYTFEQAQEHKIWVGKDAVEACTENQPARSSAGGRPSYV
jgi:hypothetical protein